MNLSDHKRRDGQVSETVDGPGPEGRSEASGGEREGIWRKVFGRIEERAVMVTLSAMTILYSLSIISRYITKISMPWAEELVRFCFIWTVFLGASIGAKKGAHLGVAVIYGAFPAKWQKVASILIAACCVFTCGVLAWKGVSMVHLQFKMGQRSSQLGVPIFLVGLAVPVGLSLCIVRFVQTLVIRLRS